MNGRVLHFYLAGINNQNFLMRDRETGTWWQQITGKAIYGPLKGAALDLVLSDELTFGEWKAEVSGGKVLAEVPKYAKEYDSKWEAEIAKLPLVLSFPGTELKSRDVVVGFTLNGASRAYPWDALVKQSPVVDHVGGFPVLVAVGPDGKSFRVFESRVDEQDDEFFLQGEETPPAPAPAPDAKAKEVPAKSADAKSDANKPADAAKAVAPAPAPAPSSKEWKLIDAATASEWNFQGCAISGPSQGKCLKQIPALKDFWFDWRNYHPDTGVYKR